jgi:hypothetical protein
MHVRFRLRFGFLAVALGITVASVPPATAQRIMYDAATHDSMAIFGFDAMLLKNGDSSLVFMYRTFLPLGDTVRARKEALGWWPVVSANVKVHGFRRAGIVVLWAKAPSDSFLEQGAAAQYAIPFVRDSSGCWHPPWRHDADLDMQPSLAIACRLTSA